MIKVSNLDKTVETQEGSLQILKNINLNVEKGESMAIVGASGSGKSTLLGLMAGLDAPSNGSIELDGTNITELDEDGRALVRAQSVGFVFQSFQLLPGLSALENVSLPLEIGLAQGAVDPKELLARVGLAQRIHHVPGQLSGGEQQRVAIARAFVTQPKILFADEPTGNLDQSTGETIIELLFKMNAEQGTTLVLVTHDNALAARCGRQLRLDSGQIVD